MTAFEQTFRRLAHDNPPYDYQLRAAEHLWGRRNLLLRAPTGAGKTLAVLAPFIHDRKRLGVRRLIYCLPLRSLAQGVYEEAKRICPADLTIKMQTGEQPDDPFFTLGDIIVSTYDQVLSGLLCGPYGQSPRQNNINAAALVGNLVVFDEFHLMEISRAFLTAVSCLQWFGPLTRSVWMTATATKPLQAVLGETLDVAEVSLSSEEEYGLFQGRSIRRALRKEQGLLTASEIMRYADWHTLIVVNRVGRAQALYEEVARTVPHAELLHARFFQSDRRTKQKYLSERFGPESKLPGLAIATQVVEAGLDFSSEHLLTEICPMNSLMQRAGRCARFPQQSGTVHVYQVENGGHLPYSSKALAAAWELIQDTNELAPPKVREWVNRAHSTEDNAELDKHKAGHARKCESAAVDRIRKQATGGVGDLIRSGSDTVRVIILDDPAGSRPSERESIPLYRSKIQTLLRMVRCGWRFDPEAAGLWSPLTNPNEVTESYIICLPPAVVRYTSKVGVQLGKVGNTSSPKRSPPARPGYGTLTVEAWSVHSKAVCQTAEKDLHGDTFEGSLLATTFNMSILAEMVRIMAHLHDLGKLQERWQHWAKAWQTAVDPDYKMNQLLAHTTGDDKPGPLLSLRRPAHAQAGAYYAYNLLPKMIPRATPLQQAAVLASILGHHGGWWSERVEVLPLDRLSRRTLAEIGIDAPLVTEPKRFDLDRLRDGFLEPLLTEHFDTAWPLMVYLTRILRLADRKATEETNLDA